MVCAIPATDSEARAHNPGAPLQIRGAQLLGFIERGRSVAAWVGLALLWLGMVLILGPIVGAFLRWRAGGPWRRR